MEPAILLGVDARIWQAVIAGGVVAAGWLVNGWQNRRAAASQRAARLRDAHKALFAEIRNACADYWDEGEADDQAATLMARMEADPDFTPFVPREVHDRVFAAMLPEIDVLPRQTIDVIVAFYALVGSIAALVEDMRGDRFETLEMARRKEVYRSYVEMRRRAFAVGQNALKLIDTYSNGGPQAAERLMRRLRAPPTSAINNQVGDRSVPVGRETVSSGMSGSRSMPAPSILQENMDANRHPGNGSCREFA